MNGDLHAHRTDVVQWAKALVAAPFTEKVAAELIDLVRFAEPDQAQMAGWALGFGEVPAGLRSEVVSALLEVPVDTTRPGAVRGQAAESG